jgi:serine/threonine protein kinase
MLDSGKVTDIQRRKYIAVLRKLSGNRGILPASHMIRHGLNKLGERPVGGGGFADVWEGSYRCQKVAIKVPRLYLSTDPAKAKKVSLLYQILNRQRFNIHQRFCKEAIVWSHISHPNVLPLIGVATSPFKFCMVSPWMENGDVISYLKSDSPVNSIRIVSSRHFVHYPWLIVCSFSSGI